MTLPPTGCVLLAAGTASRMGCLKQLLPYGDSTFLGHAVRQAREAGFAPLVVVAGAEISRIREAAASLDVHLAENPNWAAGMGSSVVCGLNALLAIQPEIAAVAITLADQPLVIAAHLETLARKLHETNPDAVAASFDGTLGPPAFFHTRRIPDLQQLSPQAGAKHLLMKPGWKVELLPLPEAAADIDTPVDFAKLVGAHTPCAPIDRAYTPEQETLPAMSLALPVYPSSRYEPSGIVDLTTKPERKRLSTSALTAFFNIMDRWQVRDEDARALLGGVSNGPYYTWKKQPERVLDSDVLTRISYLIGIFKALNILYGEKLADEWTQLPNNNRIFAGRTPLEYMSRGGVPAMQIVRRLLDARRGGM